MNSFIIRYNKSKTIVKILSIPLSTLLLFPLVNGLQFSNINPLSVFFFSISLLLTILFLLLEKNRLFSNSALEFNSSGVTQNIVKDYPQKYQWKHIKNVSIVQEKNIEFIIFETKKGQKFGFDLKDVEISKEDLRHNLIKFLSVDKINL